ncbi:MAG: hypothetical protein FWC42_06040 [Proteobacteria bacterium]|nr:hypothetical protein [Pseudomonadota bacterium]
MKQISLSDADFCAWVEQGFSIHVKAITEYGDPAELSDDEVRRLVLFLQDYLNGQDSDASPTRL